VRVNALVVCDSIHGNTERIAQTIGKSIGCPSRRVGEVALVEMAGLDLLILGMLTHGGFPTPGIDRFLKALPGLNGPRVAVFDTRTRTTVFE
jgi:flavodoxin